MERPFYINFYWHLWTCFRHFYKIYWKAGPWNMLQWYTMSKNVDIRCSFSCYNSEPCRHYLRYPNNRLNVKLKDCNREIVSHLKYLKLITAAQNDISCEADLICRCVGLFTTNYSLSVCPLHRAKLGVDYKQRKSCSHPTHIGKGETFRYVDCLQS